MPNHPDPSPGPTERATGQPDAIADAFTKLIGADFTLPGVNKLLDDLIEMITLRRQNLK